jgi:hypothetical protein
MRPGGSLVVWRTPLRFYLAPVNRALNRVSTRDRPGARNERRYPLRYDLGTPRIGRRFTLAREKNTSRAEARRRSREQTRAELAAQEDEETLDDSPSIEPEPERKPLFRIPDVRADLRALPSIFRAKPLLWLPFVLVLIGFVLALVIYGLPPDIQSIAILYIQFVFTPQSLFMYFLAGFLAPRASYLVGLILGAINGALYVIAVVLTLGSSDTALPATDIASGLLQYIVLGAVLGTFAGGFAAWYRDFLRGMQERGRQRRSGKEVDERARRREQRQEARKLAKQRPT